MPEPAGPRRGLPTESPAPGEESLGRASALMASGTLVSRVLGLVRTAMLTAVFGISLAGDAWYFSNTLPNFFYILLSAGVLNAVLIPQITKAMSHPDGGQDFVNRLVTIALTLIGAVTVVATACAPLLVRAVSGFTGPAERLAIFFAYVCLPQIAFYGLYAVLSNVLNARNKFSAVMWTPALANVVQIAGLVAFLVMWGSHRQPGTWTAAMVWTLAGTSTLGIAIQALALIPGLRATGFRWRPRWGLAGLGAASRMTLWTLTALTIQQAGGFFNTWVMNTVRTRPGNGEVAATAAQANAFQVFMLPHSLVTVSILTALFPSLSRAIQKVRLREARSIVAKGLTLPAVAVIPMSLALAALSQPLVRVIFPGLNPQEVDDTAAILSMMAIGTLSFGVATWQQRYCFAREDGRLNLWLQVLLTVVQVVFAVLGLVAFPGRYTVLSIAAGQTIGNTVIAVVFLMVANRQLAGLPLASTVRLWARLTLAGGLAGLAGWLVAWGGSGWDGWMAQVGVLVLGGIVFAVTFLAMVKLMRITEVDELLGPIVRRLRNRS